MFSRIRLWWLELRLESQLGKYDAYLNQVHDAKLATDKEKIKVAMQLLHSPPMNKGERWAAHQRVANRKAGVSLKDAETAQVPRVRSRRSRLMSRLRQLARKVAKARQPVAMHGRR